jgi:hypothetical protein
MKSSLDPLENGHSMNQVSRIHRRSTMTRQAKLETTLGDLVVALTEETERYVPDEKMTYEVVAYILANFLNGSHRHSNQLH